MKGFFNLVVIVALGFIGYIAYPAGMDFLRSKNWLPSATDHPTAGGAATDAPAPAGEPAPAPPVQPAPVVPKPAPPPAVATGSADAGIPMPVIKSLEEITGNWMKVPQKAIPPKVTLKAEASFALSQGNTMKLSAGRDAVPVALAADGTLTITPRTGSDLRATLPVDQTDFKERVTTRYNEGVARIKADVEARRAKERARIAAAAGTSEEVKSQAGEVPKSATDEERYLALMKESVANGELKDITPDKVTRWKWLGYEDVGGTGYWTGVAVFQKSTYFGEFETEAKAFIRQGKVEKWTQPGIDE